MGEAKRRKSQLDSTSSQESWILPWVPITKNQSELFVTWTTRGAWIGIALMVVIWVTIRFIGPAFGWWRVVS
jgi:hypothetical protein